MEQRIQVPDRRWARLVGEGRGPLLYDLAIRVNCTLGFRFGMKDGRRKWLNRNDIDAKCRRGMYGGLTFTAFVAFVEFSQVQSRSKIDRNFTHPTTPATSALASQSIRKAFLSFDRFMSSRSEKEGLHIEPLVRQRFDDIMACWNCGTTTTASGAKLQSCGSCRKVWYCVRYIPLSQYFRPADTPAQSKECQRADWKDHKPTCKFHTKMEPILNESEGTRLLSVIRKWAERYSFALNGAANQVLMKFKDHNTAGHLLNSHALIVRVKQTGPQSGKFTIISAEKGDLREAQLSMMKEVPPEFVGWYLDSLQGMARKKKSDVEARTGLKVAGFSYIYIKCDGMDISYPMEFYVAEETVERGVQVLWNPKWEEGLKRDVNEDVRLYKAEDGSLYELTQDGKSVPRGILPGTYRSPTSD